MPRKTEENKLREATNHWLHPWTHPASWDKHSVGKVIPHSSLGWQETPCKLGHSTSWYIKLQWMGWGSRSSMSNSCRRRYKLAEQTVNQVQINLVQHTQPSNITSMTQRQETLMWTYPGHRIHLALKQLKVTFSCWPHELENNTQGLGVKMQNSNEVTKVSTNLRFTNLKIPILSETCRGCRGSDLLG